jgi:hypothetical protein
MILFKLFDIIFIRPTFWTSQILVNADQFSGEPGPGSEVALADGGPLDEMTSC